MIAKVNRSSDYAGEDRLVEINTMEDLKKLDAENGHVGLILRFVNYKGEDDLLITISDYWE